MTGKEKFSQGPHYGQPIRWVGELIGSARAAMLMVHGRGARAEDILSLADDLAVPGFAYLAPQASENTWYPNHFMAPLASNEPWLSSALAFMEDVLTQIASTGIPLERTILLGFSQGACLALEFAVRHAQRYGGVVGLSGALIGPDDTRWDYPGSLSETPIFLGCSDEDVHVPNGRVYAAADVLKRLGGDTTVRLYTHMDHTINQDEIVFVRGMMQALVAGA